MDFLIAWWLCALGIVYLLSEAAILSSLRVIALRSIPSPGIRIFCVGLVYCRACLGFWIGGSLAFLWPEPFRFALAFILDPNYTVAVGAFSTMALGALWNGFATNSAFAIEQPDLVSREIENTDSESAGNSHGS